MEIDCKIEEIKNSTLTRRASKMNKDEPGSAASLKRGSSSNKLTKGLSSNKLNLMKPQMSSMHLELEKVEEVPGEEP